MSSTSHHHQLWIRIQDFTHCILHDDPQHQNLHLEPWQIPVTIRSGFATHPLNWTPLCGSQNTLTKFFTFLKGSWNALHIFQTTSTQSRCRMIHNWSDRAFIQLGVLDVVLCHNKYSVLSAAQLKPSVACHMTVYMTSTHAPKASSTTPSSVAFFHCYSSRFWASANAYSTLASVLHPLQKIRIIKHSLHYPSRQCRLGDPVWKTCSPFLHCWCILSSGHFCHSFTYSYQVASNQARSQSFARVSLTHHYSLGLTLPFLWRMQTKHPICLDIMSCFVFHFALLPAHLSLGEEPLQQRVHSFPAIFSPRVEQPVSPPTAMVLLFHGKASFLSAPPRPCPAASRPAAKFICEATTLWHRLPMSEIIVLLLLRRHVLTVFEKGYVTLLVCVGIVLSGTVFLVGAFFGVLAGACGSASVIITFFLFG